MKKSILLILLAACLAGSLCFTACGGNGDNGDDHSGTEQPDPDKPDPDKPDPDKPDPEKPDPYETLNKMMQAEYKKIEVSVTDTFGEGVTLSSSYTVSFADDAVTVEYQVERFAEISLDTLPEDPVETLTGKVTVKDGQVTLVEGEDIGLTVSGKLFDFKETYFGNTELTDTSLKADVKDSKSFMGVENCTDMKVEAAFAASFTKITVAYVAAAGDSVKIDYAFTA